MNYTMSPELVIIKVFISFIMSIIVASIADSKNMHAGLWFIVSFFGLGWLISLIIVCIADEKDKKE